MEVAGDAPTPAQMAVALGVEFVEVDLNEIHGRSPDLAATYDFLGMEGYGIDVPALRSRYLEVVWTSFSEWAGSIDWREPVGRR